MGALEAEEAHQARPAGHRRSICSSRRARGRASTENFPVTCQRPRFSPLRRSVTIPPALRTVSFSRSLASLFSAFMAAADNSLLAFFSPPSVPFQRFCSCSGHCVPSVEALAELRATRAYPDQGCRPVTDTYIYMFRHSALQRGFACGFQPASLPSPHL